MEIMGSLQTSGIWQLKSGAKWHFKGLPWSICLVGAIVGYGIWPPVLGFFLSFETGGAPSFREGVRILGGILQGALNIEGPLLQLH